MTTLKNHIGLVALTVLFAIAIVTIFVLANRPDKVLGSTARGSEYQATTTTTGSFFPEQLIQTGGGTFGSVVITGAAAGIINIYDATTSNPSLRAASMSSSTQLLASFPLSAAAGTYTFDRNFYVGLYVSVVGTVPTTTITYRP